MDSLLRSAAHYILWSPISKLPMRWPRQQKIALNPHDRRGMIGLFVPGF